MKKFLIPSLVVASLFAQTTNANLQKQINKLEQELKTLQQQVKQNSQLTIQNMKKVNPLFTNSHLFFSLDLRSAFDFIDKETTKGFGYTTDDYSNPGTFIINPNKNIIGKQKHTGQVWSNRFIVTGVARPSDNLKATIKLEMNKVFGPSNINQMNNPFQNFDWVSNETADDNVVRIKSAWFNYFFGPDNGLMFSIGRRPSTEGFPANLKSEDNPNHPPAHIVNMEFDGISADADSDALSHIWSKFGDWGTSILICMGRGYSNTNGKWSLNNNEPDYTKAADRANADFAGFMITPYNDGQYSVRILSMWAWNLVGFKMDIQKELGINYQSARSFYNLYVSNPAAAQQLLQKNPTLAAKFQAVMENGISSSMQVLGNYYGADLTLEAQGIGNTDNDFLNNTTAFIDFAISQTRPDSGKRMLGSTDRKFGDSIWVGADMPGLNDNDRFGISYVHGTKYWRNFSYGEDTLAGSIAAVRGNAYDVYYNHQIIPHLTLQLRYTYLKYNNPGSDAFFGDMGDPEFKAFNWVDKATDIRAYIRYQF